MYYNLNTEDKKKVYSSLDCFLKIIGIAMKSYLNYLNYMLSLISVLCVMLYNNVMYNNRYCNETLSQLSELYAKVNFSVNNIVYNRKFSNFFFFVFRVKYRI